LCIKLTAMLPQLRQIGKGPIANAGANALSLIRLIRGYWTSRMLLPNVPYTPSAARVCSNAFWG